MSTHPHETAVRDLSRDLLASLAPQELPLFGLVSRAYFQDPKQVFERKNVRDRLLGFGEGGDAAALAPALLAILTPVISFVAAEAIAAGQPAVDPAALFTPSAQAQQLRSSLLKRLEETFSLEELKTLCFTLGLDYDNFGPTKTPFIRELLLHCERRNMLPALFEACLAERPHVDWPRPPGVAPLRWTADQLRRLREIVLQTAGRLGLPAQTGDEIADRLVLSLVTA